jgi:hypothetical protein
MGIASGVASALGTGIETVYGTPVAITKRHAFLTQQVQRSQEVLQSNAITGSLAGFRRAGVISRRSAAGPLNLELAKQGMGRWLQLMAGSSTTPVQQAATTAYLQTHAAGALDRKLTMQTVFRDLAGLEVETVTHHGVMCTQWELGVNVDGIPTLNITLDAEDEDTSIASTALLALGEPAHNPFNFSQASLTIDAVPAARVTAMTATGVNPLEGGYFLGGGGTKTEPSLADFRALTGSLTAEFVDTSIYDKFVAYSSHALKLEFVAEIIASTHNYRFTINIPQAKFSGSSPIVGGPGKITLDAPFEATFNGTNPTYTLEFMSTDTTV